MTSTWLALGCTGACIQIAPESDEAIDTPTATRLFTMITVTDPYTDWDPFPGLEGIVNSNAPHEDFARVFVNDQVQSVLGSFDGLLPDGSIIVKENIVDDESEEVAALTVMWKVAGFDAGNNDWFWAKMSPEGDVEVEGHGTGCIDCHSASRGNDFVQSLTLE